MLHRFVLALVIGGGLCGVGDSAEKEAPPAGSSQADPVFRAGACAVDVSPTRLPVIVNGGFLPINADRVVDPLHARALVLDDGQTTIAICVVDSCLIPRELADQIKALAHQATGIPPDRIMISATHTHSAPSLMQVHGSDADPHYPQFLMVHVVSAIERAKQNLAPARVGWTVVNDAQHTHCRQWIFRPDHIGTDPFGETTVRANMHPGHQNPHCIGPEGPVDPALSLLSVQTPEGRPMALLANYSMHYFGAAAVSADYFGHFAHKIEKLIGPPGTDPPVVGIMSQGTSGDSMWPDYGQPAANPGLEAYAEAVAQVAFKAYQTISYQPWVPLAMRDRDVPLKMRLPDEKRLAWARQTVADLKGAPPRTLPELYAREQIYLHEHPERNVKLQAVRVGELGIVAMSCEVFGITGLKIKGQSPLQPTFNIELANGEDGYIPPPEQHKLGGYTTWACRTAGLEVTAEPKIVEAVLGMLEEVSGRPRRKVVDTHGAYAQAVLTSQPAAYWRLNEWAGPTASDAMPGAPPATFEDGVVFYLEGPPSAAFSGPEIINRSPHFAGGRLKADIQQLANTYSVELWFWNGLPNDARAVTGYFFSRGPDGAEGAPGDHLGIGGTHLSQPGKLLFFNGDRLNTVLVGQKTLEPKTWNHVVLVRDGTHVTVYLNGNQQPEIAGEAEIGFPADVSQVFFGGRNDRFANFEGKLDEVAIYRRALSAQDAAEHYQAAGLGQAAEVRNLSASSPEHATLTSKGPTPTEAKDSLALMHVAEGFRVELVAAEPLVRDPVAIEWGPDGKLWVAEMADYPLGSDGQMKPSGRIRVLDDLDGDGQYDHSTLFMEGVNFPNGILPWRKGVLVTAAPEILYAEDSDGDGKADVRKILYDGFVPGNPQLRVNGLQWGLDGWVYCANGWSGGVVRSIATDKTADIRGRDLRIRPDQGLLDPQAGVTEFGRNRDDWGHWFGCDNSNPLWHFVLEDPYTRRNPFMAPPDARRQLLAPSNPQVYSRSTSQKRYHSFEHSNRFTSACSAIIYRDDLLFPAGDEQHAFVCEPVHNLMHHERVIGAGVSFTARRPEGEQEREFLASEDPWFRPVTVRTGPDGALWVVDMYRYMIEHPDFLPPEGKAELAPFFRLGEDRGRIYRISRTDEKPRSIPRLDGLEGPRLAAALDSSSGWQRDTVQQLLMWSKDASAVPALRQLATASQNPLARIQALATLDVMEALSEDEIIAALGDSHPGVRRQAVRLAESRAAGPGPVLSAVLKLVEDSDPKVRLQLACSLGAWNDPRTALALGKLALGAQDDAYFMAAVMSSVNRDNIEPLLLEVLAGDDPQHLLVRWIEPLLGLAAAFEQDEAVVRALTLIHSKSNGSPALWQLATLPRLLQTLANRGKALESAAADRPDRQILERLQPLTRFARTIAVDDQATSDDRVTAVQVMAYEDDLRAADLEVLGGLLVPQTPREVQSAAVARLARQTQGPIAEVLLARWKSYSPILRSQVLTTLVGRSEWSSTLVDHLQDRRVNPDEIDASTRQRLMDQSDVPLRARAEKLLAISATGDRRQIVDAHQDVISIAGDAGRGKAVFQKRCSVCHRLGDMGYEVGPNLAALTDKSPRSLLVSILDPSSAVEARYKNYLAVTTDGRSFNGVLASETGNHVTLLGPEGKQAVILRQDLEEFRSSDKSPMPEGFEKDLSHQEIADLIAFIKQ